MPVMIVAEVPGHSRAGYDAMRLAMGEVLHRAPGLILHTAHPVANGWRVVEVWETKREADRFFADEVVPRLPAGIHPRRSAVELHDVVSR